VNWSATTSARALAGPARRANPALVGPTSGGAPRLGRPERWLRDSVRARPSFLPLRLAFGSWRAQAPIQRETCNARRLFHKPSTRRGEGRCGRSAGWARAAGGDSQSPRRARARDPRAAGLRPDPGYPGIGNGPCRQSFNKL
jgi:hypothetical protein